MADEVKLVTFAGETVTPTYDAIMQELYTNGGGIITGATVTIKDANTLHIADGYAAICGREVKIFASDIPVALSSSGTLNGRLYLHMDLSQPTNPLTLLTEVAASLTPVQQDANVNTTNGIYEINLATFSVGTSTISNLVSVAPTIKNINARTLQTVNDCDLSTDLQDIAGAAALSELNSNLTNLIKNKGITSASFNISANSTATASFTFTPDSGYKPLFVLMAAASTSAVIALRGGRSLNSSDTSFSVDCREITGNARTGVTIGAIVVQIKENYR